MVFAINNEGTCAEQSTYTQEPLGGEKKHISCHCAVTQIQLGSDIPFTYVTYSM